MNTVLIIESDRAIREHIAEVLTLDAYEVEIAKDGKSGVLKAQSILPDLIICCIKMPNLDGYGVLHILQNDPLTASIPFIFLTTKTDIRDHRKGMEMGADDYLLKPFEDTDLLNAVEIRLKKSQLRRTENASNEAFNQIMSEADFIEKFKKAVEDYEIRKYQANEIIFKADEYPHYVFFIERGSAKSSRLNRDGKELISSIHQVGDVFGYQPVFEERSYNETAVTLEPSELLKIPSAHFLSLIYDNPNVAGKIIKLLSRNLSDKEEELMHMAYDSVRKRVAGKLLELLPENNTGELTISRSDFAGLIGTTTETLVRTLTELKELRIIETEQSRISLIDREKLLMLLKTW